MFTPDQIVVWRHTPTGYGSGGGWGFKASILAQVVSMTPKRVRIRVKHRGGDLRVVVVKAETLRPATDAEQTQWHAHRAADQEK